MGFGAVIGHKLVFGERDCKGFGSNHVFENTVLKVKFGHEITSRSRISS